MWKIIVWYLFPDLIFLDTTLSQAVETFAQRFEDSNIFTEVHMHINKKDSVFSCYGLQNLEVLKQPREEKQNGKIWLIK